MKVLLRALSCIWSGLYRLRRYLYNKGFLKSYKLHIPVISVGNLSFGGTGKTPFVIYLVEKIQTLKNKKAVVLSRGYKSKLETEGAVILAKQDNLDPLLYGDEPTQIVQNTSHADLIVGKNRYENFQQFHKELEPAADFVVLDDGFQHLKIQRDLNILLFDIALPVDRYFCAPRGYLRERLEEARAADVIVYTKFFQGEEKKLAQIKSLLKEHIKNEAIELVCEYRENRIKSLNGDLFSPESFFKNKEVVALSGIAKPGSFYVLLERIGAKIVKKANFSDHHNFEYEEIASFQEASRIIVTTEKDFEKIKALGFQKGIYCLTINIELSGQEKEFEQLLQSII